MNTASIQQATHAQLMAATGQVSRSGGGAAFLEAMARMAQEPVAQSEAQAGAAVAKSAPSADLDAASAAMRAVMAATTGAGSTSGTQAASLQEMLEARHPGIHYHVFDASSSNWKTRTDYPHHLLYTDGNKARETLENWKPEGENPFYGSRDGQFIAPKEIRALERVAPGSKAVVIHPKVQERMEEDPAYAQEIFQRIEAWFALDVARNDVIRAAHGDGSCEGIMSQAVAIGEDGNICNAQASSQGTITMSSSGGSDRSSGARRTESGWEARLRRHDEMMALIVEARIQHKIQVSRENSDLAAKKAQLADMLQKRDLQKILGDHVSGMPTASFLSLVGAQMAAIA